jgi:hypothetical protein
LSIITRTSEDDETLCTCLTVDGFPQSQHRSVLLHHGIRIQPTTSVLKLRWNFQRANWESFADDLDSSDSSMPLQNDTSQNYDELYEEI